MLGGKPMEYWYELIKAWLIAQNIWIERGKCAFSDFLSATKISIDEAAYAYTLSQGIFIDRGDPAGSDFPTGDFTKDATWRELDLSSIVPAGAKAVLIKANIQAATVSETFNLRKHGNVNGANSLAGTTQTADVVHRYSGIVWCSTDRKIDYKIDMASWNIFSMNIKGWFL